MAPKFSGEATSSHHSLFIELVSSNTQFGFGPVYMQTTFYALRNHVNPSSNGILISNTNNFPPTFGFIKQFSIGIAQSWHIQHLYFQLDYTFRMDGSEYVNKYRSNRFIFHIAYVCAFYSLFFSSVVYVVGSVLYICIHFQFTFRQPIKLYRLRRFCDKPTNKFIYLVPLHRTPLYGRERGRELACVRQNMLVSLWMWYGLWR